MSAVSDSAAVFAAVGTVGAFGVSLRLLFVQRADRREDMQERRKQQARLIVAWPGERARPSFLESDPYLRFEFITRNNSPEPAYDVYLRMPFGRSGTFVRSIEELPPDTLWRTWVKVDPATGASPSVWIMFRDASGRRWMRDDLGELKEASDDDRSWFIEQDSGAYGSVAEHPTLNVLLNENGNLIE